MGGRAMVDINHVAVGTQGANAGGVTRCRRSPPPLGPAAGPGPGRPPATAPARPLATAPGSQDSDEGRTHGRRLGLPRVGRRLATMGLLVALGVTLLAAVPSLRGVLREIGDIGPGWIAAAVALELASAVSFVVVFRLFFDGLDARDARILAWTAQGSGALLPGRRRRRPRDRRLAGRPYRRPRSVDRAPIRRAVLPQHSRIERGAGRGGARTHGRGLGV